MQSIRNRVGALILATTAAVAASTHAVASAQSVEGGSSAGQFTSSEMPFDPRASTSGNGAPQNNFIVPFFQGLVQPRLAPAGANDWGCKPSAEHPKPVVLVHGTLENAYNKWAAMAPALKRDGYCVFTPNFGRTGFLAQGGLGAIAPNTYGIGQIENSAKSTASFVDAVLQSTGASQVDLVGHSQGGVVARYYAAFEGGVNEQDPEKSKVGKIITLGATNHGTTLTGLADLGEEHADAEGSLATEDGNVVGSTSGSVEGPLNVVNDISGLTPDQRVELKKWLVGWAGAEQAAGSDFLKRLNAKGDTLSGVDYTVIATQFDNISNPYQWTFLEAGPGATVKNITLQDGCSADKSSHVSMSYSPRAIDYVRNALDPQLVPDNAIRCEPHAAALGINFRSLV